MPFYLSTIFYAFLFSIAAHFHIGLAVLLHFIPSLFFIYIIKDKYDFQYFLLAFSVILLLLPIVNWGFLFSYFSIKKQKSLIYNKQNQYKLFKEYEHSFLTRVAIKNKYK